MNIKTIARKVMNVSADGILSNFTKAISSLEDLEGTLVDEVAEARVKAMDVAANTAVKIQKLGAKRDEKIEKLNVAANDAEVELKKTVRYIKNLKAMLEA